MNRFGTCVDADAEWCRTEDEAAVAAAAAAAAAMWWLCGFERVADAVEDATRDAIVVLIVFL